MVQIKGAHGLVLGRQACGNLNNSTNYYFRTVSRQLHSTRPILEQSMQNQRGSCSAYIVNCLKNCIWANLHLISMVSILALCRRLNGTCSRSNGNQPTLDSVQVELPLGRQDFANGSQNLAFNHLRTLVLGQTLRFERDGNWTATILNIKILQLKLATILNIKILQLKLSLNSLHLIQW